MIHSTVATHGTLLLKVKVEAKLKEIRKVGVYRDRDSIDSLDSTQPRRHFEKSSGQKPYYMYLRSYVGTRYMYMYLGTSKPERNQSKPEQQTTLNKP